MAEQSVTTEASTSQAKGSVDGTQVVKDVQQVVTTCIDDTCSVIKAFHVGLRNALQPAVDSILGTKNVS